MRFKNYKECLIPADEETKEKLLLLGNDILLKEVNNRDDKFHRCYFVWCGWLWDKMPLAFRLHRCNRKEDMYKYLKLVSGQFEHSIKFKEHCVIEFKSISFSRMKESEFREYVQDQINAFYIEVLVPLKMESLQTEMEQEFKKLFNELI